MKKAELLAPAGSLEKAEIALIYGADAIYVGTPELSLRSRSKVAQDDFEKIVKLAHSMGKKVYAAINIYAKDDSYEKIKEQVKLLASLNIDAIIVSDGGVVDVVRELAPQIPVHISTQANTISLPSCNFWQKNGASRIILGREINKEELRHIQENKDPNLEIEVFVHGAICFAYSGRCYLSDYLAHRSANQGDCAQCCRWNYRMYVEDQNNKGELLPVEEGENGTTIFSSKDLCLIDEIPELIDMGVESFKIEGRLKTEYYLASVINTYKCAIKEYEETGKFDPEKYKKELDKIKTRPLTKFNFNIKNNNDPNDIQDFNGRQYNQFYAYGALIEKPIEVKGHEDKNLALVYIKNKLTKGDVLELLIPGKLEGIEFTIDTLIDVDTLEEIDTINPGKVDQMVILNIPNEKVEKNYIIRKKLDNNN